MLLGHAYICFSSDSLGKEAAFAAMNDEVEQVRRINQKIDLANQIWKSFVLRSDGSIIELEGAEGKVEISPDYLGDVAAIVEQYKGAIGSTLSVGVGMELSEANRAMAVARLQGGDQIVLWDPSMTEALEEAQKDPDKTKVLEDTLAKADSPAHSVPTKDAPVKTQKDHDEGAVTSETAAGQPEPEMTHAAKDFESQMHDMAQDQDKKDAQNQQKQQGDHEKLKAQVLQILDQVKAQSQVLALIKQANPQAYQAVMFLVQSVILLGRELVGQESQQQPMQKGEALQGGKADGMSPDDFDPNELTLGIQHELEHTKDPKIAEEIAMDHLMENPKYYTELEASGVEDGDKLTKEALPQNNPLPHHHQNLPVGTQVNGKVKVTHGPAQGGKTSWKSMRAGQIASQDSDAPLFGANTHPTSSREPGAR